MSGAGTARLIGGDDIGARALRFACIGGINAAVYAAVTALLVSGSRLAPVLASIAGYCVAMPLGFIGHRQFSFRSRRRIGREALRFIVTQAINLAVTVIAMSATVAGLGLSYVWGMAATIVLLPMANFAAMHFWVFGARAGDRR